MNKVRFDVCLLSRTSTLGDSSDYNFFILYRISGSRCMHATFLWPCATYRNIVNFFVTNDGLSLFCRVTPKWLTRHGKMNIVQSGRDDHEDMLQGFHLMVWKSSGERNTISLSFVDLHHPSNFIRGCIWYTYWPSPPMVYIVSRKFGRIFLKIKALNKLKTSLNIVTTKRLCRHYLCNRFSNVM